MKVLFVPDVREYLRELSEILYEKEYLGLEESAVKYVRELIMDISDSLPSRLKKIAPAQFSRYGTGMFYAVFKKNKTTQWYVFFNIYVDEDEPVYLVRYISNNHVVAQHL